QHAQPPAAGLLAWVIACHDHPCEPRVHDRFRARRRAAVVAARLERHVHRRAGRIGGARGQGLALCVRHARRGVEALADGAPVLHDHGADEWVRAGPAAPPAGARWRPSRPTGPAMVTGAILAAILGVGLYVRLRHNGYGLPYVYNYDEANHFVNHSVAMLQGPLDPGYYQNPSGFTYVIYLLLRVVYGVFNVHLSDGTVVRQFAFDPTPIWKLARGAAAGLACGFKYTAGLVILALVVAAAARIWRDRGTPWLKRRDLRFLVLAGLALVVAFAITTPYFFVHPDRALSQIQSQAQAAG